MSITMRAVQPMTIAFLPGRLPGRERPNQQVDASATREPPGWVVLDGARPAEARVGGKR
ncbi:hypothetical protein [Streptomyces sp. NRRL S-378]|uniref:hypothetical protein n=1 Tax=Streptomyces sp. NRRL S-378 TaxID=1463904 RepID=UPI0018FE4A8D|nr:hypothetical protein [Streptomyces sp. NRRL S-378]